MDTGGTAPIGSLRTEGSEYMSFQDDMMFLGHVRSVRPRQQTLDRICARKRGDAFARALCGAGRRPEIRELTELLRVLVLDGRAPGGRAFALTGNSTSLVATSSPDDA